MNEDKINIVLIEDNKQLCKSIESYLKMKSSLRVVGIAHDGVEGIALLKTMSVDIVLLDIVLPIMDGISVLEEMRPLMKEQGFIMLTAVSKDSMTKRAMELGADYFVLKPFDMELLVKRIIEIHNDKKKNDFAEVEFQIIDSNNNYEDSDNGIEDYVDTVFNALGISRRLDGYAYLKYAVMKVIEDRSLNEGITKVLYPLIAKKFDTKSNCVERSIRHAIKKCWEKGNGKSFYKLLNFPENYFKGTLIKPTNGAFITLVSEYYIKMKD